MTGTRVFISGLGLISALGTDLNETRAAFDKGLKGIRPLGLFPTPDNQPLPVGEIRGLTLSPGRCFDGTRCGGGGNHDRRHADHGGIA